MIRIPRETGGTSPVFDREAETVEQIRAFDGCREGPRCGSTVTAMRGWLV
jgi:hypothetical protein